MIKNLKDYCRSLIIDNGFTRDNPSEHPLVDGEFYTMRPDKGIGTIRLFQYDSSATVLIANFTPHEDIQITFDFPKSYTIAYFYYVSASISNSDKYLSPGRIYSKSSNLEPFTITFKKNILVSCITHTFTPDFYKKHLWHRYPNLYEEDIEHLYESLNGLSIFPELANVFDQIHSFIGNGLATKMYFESKAIEALSLIIKKTHSANANNLISTDETKLINKKFSPFDYNAILSVCDYIDNHFSETIKEEYLAQIACMSCSKLKYLFKAIQKTTIRQYILDKRVDFAKHLIENSSMPIAQIANIVGYKNSSSFSDMFRKNTGMTPSEYKKSIKNTHDISQ